LNSTADTPDATRITLPVDGMTCAACQANVQRALTATPGVTKANVNLMTHEATVQYDAAATTPEKLVAAINDTGYVSRLPDANAVSQDSDQAREEKQRREYATVRSKAVVSLILGAAAMIASMPLMSVSHTAHSGDLFLRWTMSLDAPVRSAFPFLYGIEPFRLLLVLFGATTLVMAWASPKDRAVPVMVFTRSSAWHDASVDRAGAAGTARHSRRCSRGFE